MTALQVDWGSLCTSICSSIKRVPRTNFNRVVVFGNEWLIIRLQTHWHRLPISCILQYYLFGNNSNKVEQNGIERTPKTFLFHIASMERAKQIFNNTNLCGAEVYVKNNNKIWYFCCGKVSIINLDTNSEIGGCILEEIDTQWKVQLAYDCIFSNLVPIYNNDTNS